ncbi:cysteine desulfurase family protein [Halalkalibacter hemicellulosilyticus]|uniref:cysteine desulfurase n=1 Tax=Halalkalibacter hemicellulosilyticusJCM 9152 TaxID=1236971 RepID=W4QKM3_9BACI|nr:cysteine desulfurase family protein [Halalkalibacter hemicellulosilyticus]GAE32193.1 cysteine desulfurase [Halalkalibacter hemicellulosilyticusJCM 9152]
MEFVYVDHAATSPVHPDVLEAMMPYYGPEYGNPSSIHQAGRRARAALDQARSTMATLLGVKEQTLIFTSGGTEADNLAIVGYALEHQAKGKHIITSQIEHHAVIHACQELEKRGFDVTYLPVDTSGTISRESVEKVLREDTILVTLMYGNNEVGTVQPIVEIGELLLEHQAAFHTDAVQACGVLDLNFNTLPVDMASISAHKVNGPKGVGLLYTTKRLKPLLYGGEQERKRRAGTENVAAVVGFAKALQLVTTSIQGRREQYELFSQQLVDRLLKEEVEFTINGHQHNRLPHIMNISFPGVQIEPLLMNLDLANIAASSGSACTAGSVEPSHVLVAMFGKDDERLTSAVRFSFGLGNTGEQIEYVATKTAEIVKRLKQTEQII